MKLNLFKTRSSEIIPKNIQEISGTTVLKYTQDYGIGNYLREKYYPNAGELEGIDNIFFFSSIHDPIYISLPVLPLNNAENTFYILADILGFSTGSESIRSSVWIPIISYQNHFIEWNIKLRQNKPYSRISLDSRMILEDLASTKKQTEEDYIYRIKNIIFNVSAEVIESNVKVVSKKTYNNLKENTPQYQLLGFWNFASNEMYTFYDNKKYTDITKTISDFINKTNINKKVTKLFTVGYDFTLGYEEEFLFLNPENQIVPATEVFVQKLQKDYQGLSEEDKNYLISRGRETLNTIFNRTGIGTDGRRILGEIRGTYYNCHARNTQQTLCAINKLWGAIESSYQELYKTGHDILIGGGAEGETIGTHIHFNVQPSPEFVILLNKIFGSKLQNMVGGKRPEYINPADRFTTDSGQRTPNTYGRIINDISTIRNDFNDNHGVQVRTKTNGDASVKWWEWRIPPACFLNKTYTINLLMSIYEIIYKASKGYEFPSVNDAINNKNLLDIFEKNQYFWEWYFMSNSLYLTTSPFKYVIYTELDQMIHGSNFLILKTSKKESFVKDPENFDLERLRFLVGDYINPQKQYILKYERSKENTVIIHQDKKAAFEFWLNITGIQITPIYKTNKEFKNSCFIQGYYTADEILQLTKIALMIS